MVLSARLRAATTRSVLAAQLHPRGRQRRRRLLGGGRLPIDTLALWDYGTGRSLKSLAALLLICLVLFATFISIGVMIATLLGRAGDDLPRLYFADLLGAGLGCAVVVYLITWITPQGTIAVSALLLAATGAVFAATGRPKSPPGPPLGPPPTDRPPTTRWSVPSPWWWRCCRW